MKNFTSLIVASVLAAAPLCAVAQVTIKVTVTDGTKGERLPGVSIVLGQQIGAATSRGR